MHKANLDHEKQHNESINMNHDYEIKVDTIVNTGLGIERLAFHTRWKRLSELPVVQNETIVNELKKACDVVGSNLGPRNQAFGPR